jgi:hypothetical protein
MQLTNNLWNENNSEKKHQKTPVMKSTSQFAYDIQMLL